MDRGGAGPVDWGLPFEALEPRLLLDGAPAHQGVELFGTSPALFVANEGQWADGAVRYAFHGSGANVLHTDAGPVFDVFQARASGEWPEGLIESPGGPAASDGPPVGGTRVSVTFSGASCSRPVGLDRSDAVVNYFLGEQGAWRAAVPTFETIAYIDLYNGIDLYTWGRRDSLKYEFRMAPGADWQQIEVRCGGIEGLALDAEGRLHLALGAGWGDVVDEAPYAYQVRDGQRIEVSCGYALLDDVTYGFRIDGPYDPSAELIIDPDLMWSSYLGGGSADDGRAIAVDEAGRIWVAGHTTSADLPEPRGGGTSYSGMGQDAFVAGLTAEGELAWVTYLGGNGDDEAHGIAADGSCGAFVTGTTASSDLPTPGGFDRDLGGSEDAFLAQVGASGELLWASYLGGHEDDAGRDVDVDPLGTVWVTGETSSADFPTPGGFDTALEGPETDAFIAKITAWGELEWASFLGGRGSDAGEGIAVAPPGGVVVVGSTSSDSGIATPGASQGWHRGQGDAFVARIEEFGRLAWATYLGGAHADVGHDVAVDGMGNALVTGTTGSGDFPAQGGFDTSFGGPDTGNDAFVAKLTPSGYPAWSSFLGGDGEDVGWGIAADESGSAWVTGSTTSAGFPTPGGFDSDVDVDFGDAYVVHVTPSGELAWGSALGGGLSDSGHGIAVDDPDDVWVTGATMSLDFPAPGGFDVIGDCLGGDAFVARIEPGAPPERSLCGSVSTFAGVPVPGATLSLTGAGQQTQVSDAAGEFAFDGLVDGPYTLRPSKSDDVAGITAYDACLTLRYYLGLTDLSAEQRLAADVDRDGSVSVIDVLHILQGCVGLTGVPFPGADRVWDFIPRQRDYSAIGADLAGQDFTAVLLGDPSGNWPAPRAPGPGPDCKLSLGVAEGQYDGQVAVPLTIDPQWGDVQAVDLEIAYDAEALSVDGLVRGPVGEEMVHAEYTGEPGTIRLAFADHSPLESGGLLATITFTVVGSLSGKGELRFSRAEVDEGAVPVDLTNGLVRDTISPVVEALHFDEAASPQTLSVRFSEDVLCDGVVLRNETADQDVDPGLVASQYVWGECEAQFAFTGFPDGRLPYGDSFSVTFPGAQTTDVSGNGLDGNGDGAGGDDYVGRFVAAMAGDADLDGTVNARDYIALKRNFGASGGADWSQADSNGDGNVDRDDFLLLKENFGREVSLPAPATAEADRQPASADAGKPLAEGNGISAAATPLLSALAEAAVAVVAADLTAPTPVSNATEGTAGESPEPRACEGIGSRGEDPSRMLTFRPEWPGSPRQTGQSGELRSTTSQALTVPPLQTEFVDAVAALSAAQADSSLPAETAALCPEVLASDQATANWGLGFLTAMSLDVLAMAELLPMAL